MADAELVLYVGGGFQPALEDAIASTSARAVDLLDAVETSGGDDGHDLDPHVWLDPVRFAAVARRIGEELDRRPNAERLATRLGALDREIRAGLARCERRQVVTSHAAFGYLADRYGLEQVAITGIAPEAEPTPRDLERVVQAGPRGRRDDRLLRDPRLAALAETVAREVGATTGMLDPLESLTDEKIAAGGDYVSVMRANLAALRKGLGCRSRSSCGGSRSPTTEAASCWRT